MSPTERSKQNSSGAASTTSVRKDRRGRNCRCPVHWTVLEIPVATRSGQLEPVACSSRPDLAPRGAVRKVGPRPDQTRSACTDEPGEPASWPGDQSWGPCSPYRWVNQPSAADMEKNGGESSDLNRSVCGTAVAAERLDGRPFFAHVLFLSPITSSKYEGSSEALRRSIKQQRNHIPTRLSRVGIVP